MDAKSEELDRLHRDLQAMGEKVMDEIEKRTQLQVNIREQNLFAWTCSTIITNDY